MRTLTLIAVSLAVVLLVPTVSADEAKDQIKAFKEQMKSGDEATRIKLIQELADSANPGASKAISSYMSNRSTAVAVAAITAIGKLKDKKYLGKLMGMIKPNKDKPKVLAAVALAIGEMGNRKGIDTLVDLAKKWMPKDSSVASAAAKGLGKIPDKRCVEESIKLLDLSYPKSASGGASVSQETRDRYAASRPSIMGALGELTGWDFESARSWKYFWAASAKSWKPGQNKEIQWADLKSWYDPGYGFKIEKPDKRWEIQRGENVRIQLCYYVLNSDEQRIMNSSVWITAYDLSNFKSLTATQKADQKWDWYQSNWKDVKTDTFVRNDRYKLGNTTGIMIQFTGRDTAGNIMKQKNVYLTDDNYMYEIGTWRRSGTKEFLVEHVDKAIASFRLTRRK